MNSGKSWRRGTGQSDDDSLFWTVMDRIGVGLMIIGIGSFVFGAYFESRYSEDEKGKRGC